MAFVLATGPAWAEDATPPVQPPDPAATAAQANNQKAMDEIFHAAVQRARITPMPPAPAKQQRAPDGSRG